MKGVTQDKKANKLSKIRILPEKLEIRENACRAY
jgi:hypothetical protein